MLVIPELVKMAEWSIEQQRRRQAALTKSAFVPPGGPGGAPPGGPPQGGPPMDPSMDPAMMGGAPPGGPPMDPAMMGGAPPGPPPGPPPGGDPMAMMGDTIRNIIRDEMARAGAPAAGGAGGAGGKMKADPNAAAMDAYQTKKLITNLYHVMGIPIPPDILDGPNRDPATGMPVQPGAGTSDPGAPPAQGGPAGAIPPIQPVPPAFGPAPGGQKAAAERQPVDIGYASPDPRRAVGGMVSAAAAVEAVLAAHTRRVAD